MALYIYKIIVNLSEPEVIYRLGVLQQQSTMNTMHANKGVSVGAVSYLNTKPLIYGFEQGMMQEAIALHIGYPARIAAMLLNDEIDIGLVPVAIIPKLQEYYLNTDYCIGAEGAVASVCLFSEVPLAAVEKVLLDYQSRTSVALARVLLKEYWKIQPELVDAKEDYIKHITGTTAGLVIGDRALQQRKQSAYMYDLGQAWKDHTGLPFVFAAWVSNKKLDDDFVKHFNEANKFGLERIGEVVAKNPYAFFNLREYFTKCISYRLTENKKKGMKLFLEKIALL